MQPMRHLPVALSCGGVRHCLITPRQEERIAIVTSAGRAVVDATLSGVRVMAGRRHVVSEAYGGGADGDVARCWCLDARAS